MNDSKAAYRHIFKATSILGGVQVITIFAGIIRNKFSAVWLGTDGVGMMALYTSAILLITQICNLGISTSSVKNISNAFTSSDKEQINKVVSIVKVLALYTGILSAIVMVASSFGLSLLNFGTGKYYWAFILLSIAALFQQLASGKLAIIQGVQQTKLLAKASIYGTIISSIITLPLLYFYRKDGIIPVIISGYIVGYLLALYFEKKLSFSYHKVAKEIFREEAKDMIKLGIMISLAAVVTQLYMYVIRIMISNWGSIEEVGLYSAGFAIITTYFGMVFTAMGTDYFPRLSGLVRDNNVALDEMNRQAEMALLVITPLLVFFVIFMKIGIVLLYSKEFLPMVEMLQWAVLGVFFQAFSWSLAFMLLAKGDSKLFFWNELITIIYFLLINVLGYKLWGLKGLGISFFINYVIYSLQMLYVTNSKYNFKLSNGLKKIFLYNLILIACIFLVNLIFEEKTIIIYCVEGLIAVASLGFSFFELNKKLEIFKNFKLK